MRTYKKYMAIDGEIEEIVPSIPEKRGRWMNVSGSIKIDGEVLPLAECSACGTLFHLEGHKFIMTYRHCPECGARMME